MAKLDNENNFEVKFYEDFARINALYEYSDLSLGVWI